MPDEPTQSQRYDDRSAATPVGRFNRLKEHAPFRDFWEPPPQPAAGVLYFSAADASSIRVDLAGATVILARGPCLPPREENDDYLSMPPLAPILLANVLRAYGARVGIRDLLASSRRPLGRTTALVRQPIRRQEWSRAMNDDPSPRVSKLIEGLLRLLRPAGADGIGLSVETAGDFPLALCLARTIRQRFSVPTIIGGRGVHLPEPLMAESPHAVVVHGEGEVPLVLALDALLHRRPLDRVPSIAFVEEGSVRATRAMIHDLDTRPTFDLAGAPLEGYRGRIEVEGSGPTVPYQYSIGCPFPCGYCNATSRRAYRLRAPDKIVADLAQVVRRSGVQRFHMLSHLLNADRRHLDELLRRLENADLGIYWSDSCRPAGIDEDTLLRMRRVGASVLVWGVDCGSPRLARIMSKGIDHERALHLIKASHRAGIRNIVNIIVGMPRETAQDLEEALRFIERATPYVQEFQLPPYRFHPESLLARNPERYGLVAGSSGGVDEPEGLSWSERQAQMPAVAQHMRDHDPRVTGYDLQGRLTRIATGPGLAGRLARRLASTRASAARTLRDRR
ncbi:MAG: B12-binding domain-containing radical SAM protein [Deltaproteobacteria bacterium]|jgi:hypothetical protein|nr:B12-binding domain-containing radical SAM protein [Deltaproteobacteria bacterium]MBW2533967.1 B12-binding domain-containing radical SAM protein [Deltaproteobacteria bacterium]